MNSPVRLDSIQLLLESVRRFDEYRLGNQVDAEMVLNEVRDMTFTRFELSQISVDDLLDHEASAIVSLA